MNLTSEDIQRYTRIGLQWLAAAMVTHGSVNANASWVEPAIGVAVGIASLLWTLYGNRINAKINELKKADPTAVIVLTDALAMAHQAASPQATNVLSHDDVKVVQK